MTSEQACINYAVAAEAVKLLSQSLRTGICERVGEHLAAVVAGMRIDNCPEECLHDFFVDDLESEDMCSECERKLELVRQRKDARLRLGQAKRAVFTVGKRLNRVASSGHQD